MWAAMSIIYWLAGGILLAIAWADTTRHQIPALFVALLICCGIVRAFWRGGWPEMFMGLLLCGLPILLVSISLQKGFIGGGDIKLCAALGAFLGPIDALLVISAALICLSVFGLAKHAENRRIPFAPFVFPIYVVYMTCIFTLKGLS